MFQLVAMSTGCVSHVFLAFHLVTSTFTLCGRRGTWHWAGSGGALGSRLSPWLFVWQAWQSEASTSILCGRCGTWRHQPSLCVAGVALARIHLHSVWQAWHLATSTFTLRGRCGTCGTGLALVARLGAVSRPSRRGTLRGRRGTCSHELSFCVASVALGDIHLRFACQAWHLATSAFVWRAKRGIW